MDKNILQLCRMLDRSLNDVDVLQCKSQCESTRLCACLCEIIDKTYGIFFKETGVCIVICI